jgi:ADP-ribose pyrophosphatase YjhB (NUDIX family)
VVTTLEWARELQAIAQSGLAWSPREYDRERYEQVRRVAAEMLANGSDAAALEAVFAAEEGHATPKLDVRGAVFRGDGILLVQEREGEGWSLPGGWVDVGESPGEAVAREVLEESGVAVRDVRYVASQPWPFPSSLMCGFIAPVTDDKVTIDKTELETARWFSRAEVLEMARRSAAGDGAADSLAPPIAIGHHLARRWATGEF